MKAPARNMPCPCGSGKKFKHCCIALQSPSAPEALATLESGLALHRAGQLDEAAAHYRRLLAARPDHCDALHLLGLVLHQQGRHSEAHPLVARAAGLQPGAALIHNNLGEICRELGRPGEALRHYRRAEELAGPLPETARNIGLALLALGKPREAVMHLENALSRHTAHLALMRVLALAYSAAGALEQALSTLEAALGTAPNDIDLIRAKAKILNQLQRSHEALDLLQGAVAESPDSPALIRSYAQQLVSHDQFDAAQTQLERLLILTPEDTGVRHDLDALRGLTPERVPTKHVREIFDYYAPGFDEHLVSKLGYRTPELLADMLAMRLAPGRALCTLDLGCGTGLMGAALRQYARPLTGVDVSGRMLEQAAKRKLYDTLIEADLLDYLPEQPAKCWDLLTAADVFNYFGDLSPLFRAAARLLVPGGYFLFSTENLIEKSARACVLDPKSGRFQHAPDHVAALAGENGFQVIEIREGVLRYEKDQPVSGSLFLFESGVASVSP